MNVTRRGAVSLEGDLPSLQRDLPFRAGVARTRRRRRRSASRAKSAFYGKMIKILQMRMKISAPHLAVSALSGGMRHATHLIKLWLRSYSAFKQDEGAKFFYIN